MRIIVSKGLGDMMIVLIRFMAINIAVSLFADELIFIKSFTMTNVTKHEYNKGYSEI